MMEVYVLKSRSAGSQVQITMSCRRLDIKGIRPVDGHIDECFCVSCIQCTYVSGVIFQYLSGHILVVRAILHSEMRILPFCPLDTGRRYDPS